MMTEEQFEKLARSLKSKAEVEELCKNAIGKGRHDLAQIGQMVLEERFPLVASTKTGAKPTRAKFQEREQHFPSGKEAYVWLLSRLVEYEPQLLESVAHKPPYATKRRRVFARTAAELFAADSPSAFDGNKHAKLPNGWLANLVLSHDDKFKFLLRLASICKLSYPQDFDFKVLHLPSPAIAATRALQDAVSALESELDRFPPASSDVQMDGRFRSGDS